MAEILRLYRRALHEHPIIVQSIQVGIVMGVGDTLAQTFATHKKDSQQEPHNFKRTRNFIVLGTFLIGPASTQWFRILDRYVTGKPSQRALKKVACDQLIFAPIFLAVFLMSLQTLEKGSVKEARKAVAAQYPTLLKANYVVWPWVQLCNFYVIPVNYQVLFVQMVGLVWNVYLSYQTH